MNRSAIPCLSLTLLILLTSCTLPATQTPGSPPTVTETIIPTEPSSPTETETAMDALSPFDAVKLMQRGVNMGNTLESPTEGEWGFVITREQLEAIQPMIDQGLPFEYTLKGIDVENIALEKDAIRKIWEGATDAEIMDALDLKYLPGRMKELMELQKAGYEFSFDAVTNSYVLVLP